MEYRLCDDPWGREELDAIQRVVDSRMFTMGENVKTCEENFARRIGSAHAIMVNSGSSANLLAIAALVYSKRLPRGSEVIVPAVSWSTTYSPLEQFGMKIVFVDIDADTLNMSIPAFRQAVTDQTRMVVLVNLLGNANAFDEILPLCREKNILVVEDNCESLGAQYNGKQLGTFGLLGTYSFFYSHHICTMEGGMVVTDDTALYEYMLVIRAHGWTRNLPKKSALYAKNGNPFYESYHFILPGFNMRPLEMEGALGIEQLRKLDGMIERRRSNAAYFLIRMAAFPEIRLQREHGQSSWFGFSMVLTGSLKGKRDKLVKRLMEKNIEVRPIVAGNFTRNPAIEYMDYRIDGTLSGADDIHDNGFFIGNHSKINRSEVDYFISVLRAILSERGF